VPPSAPGFTFAAGNAKKVLALPAYALGALASVVVPRRRDLWAFGCGSGIGEGALALYRYTAEHDPARRLVWLARDERERAEAVTLGIPAVVKSTARGLWTTLRAGVVVITHGFGDANRYGTRGGFVVQLWHGIPLKLINLDSPATMRTRLLPDSAVVRRVLRLMYRTAARSISLFPAASEVSAGRLRTAFALPAARVVVTGDPRDDVMVTGSEEERTANARALVFERLGLVPDVSRLLLYAPTWRDGETDPGVPTAAEWRRIADFLERTGSRLIVRPHHLGVGDYEAGVRSSDRIHLLTVHELSDVTPALPAIDTLVTDYSSIAFDFALAGRPIVYLAPDVDSYTASRGLYVPYATFSGGSETADWTGLLDLLERADADPAVRDRLAGHAVRLAELHHAFRDGRNTGRVYSEIIARTGERR
jgi:CDP-glycerol glycerophosphotransferase